jgi:ATP-dependent DNA helicase RecG
VAALAACQAIDAGYQAALMAPTEILAEQHFASCPHGWNRLACRGLAGGQPEGKEKREAVRAPNRARRW